MSNLKATSNASEDNHVSWPDKNLRYLISSINVFNCT